jgi:glycosyltransferase involved in cell wall biosynthesis
MGGDVPPRVTYWTGVWEPTQEALSKEIELLRSSRAAASLVVSFASGQRTALMPRRGAIRLNGDRWALLRAIAAGAERRGDVTHVFGSLDEWHLLRAVGRRPVIFTAAIDGHRPSRDLWRKVEVFAAETDMLAASLVRAGAPPGRVRVIHPGIDLREYVPRPAPPRRPFRILFASSPACPSEFEARGIPLLVEVARACRGVEIVLLWRDWGNQDEALRALQALDPPPNVVVERCGERTMADVFAAAHAVVCAYAPGFGKSAPNSVIEGLACGRPAILTESCGLVGVVTRGGAGESAARFVGALAGAIEALRSRYDDAAAAARRLAEREFNATSFCAAYDELYERLARQGVRGREPAVRTRLAPY